MDGAFPDRPGDPEAARARFREAGFFVTPPLFGPETLAGLLAECDRVRAAKDAALGAAREGITLAGRRYFLPGLHRESDLCRRVCTESPLVDLAIALLGPEVRLYWNQAVLKPAGRGAGFAWHQDTGYVPIEPQEYLTCWLALEDATLENGCVRVLPGSHHWGLQPHRRDEALGDQVGYTGPEEGLPVPVAAGQVIAFSSLLLHSSGPNVSGRDRGAYVVQYCPTHAVRPDTGERWGDDLPVAAAGRPLRPRSLGDPTCLAGW